MRLFKVAVMVGVAFLLFGQADTILQRAIRKETIEGDLKGAIELYREAARQAGKDRTTAAKALVRMGTCFEKLGDAEARKAFEQVVREYADQKESVVEARRHLAAKEPSAPTGVTAQRLWVGGHDGRYYRAIAPDGRLAIFSGPASEGTLFAHDLRTGEVRRLMEPLVARRTDKVAISPDSKRAAYQTMRPESKIWVVDLHGGDPRVVAEGKDFFFSLYGWSSDGKQVLIASNSQSSRPKVEWVSVIDGSRKGVDSLGCKAGRCSGSGWSDLSPDGHFVVGKAWTNQPGLFVAAVEGGEPTLIVEGEAFDGHWSPDGKGVLFASNRRGIHGTWFVQVSAGKPVGSPEMVRDLGPWGNIIGLSSNGDFYYEYNPTARDVYVADLDTRSEKLAGQPKRITDRNMNVGPAWSPDGEFLVYYSQAGQDNWTPGALKIVIRSMKTGEERLVSPKTPLVFGYTKPQWFPDGQSLFIHEQSGRLIKLDAQTGNIEYLFKGERIIPSNNFPNHYFPPATLAANASFVTYVAQGGRIIRRNLPDGKEIEVSRVGATNGVFPSPDGAKIAFWANSKLMIVPATGGAPVEVKTGLTLEYVRPRPEVPNQSSATHARATTLAWGADSRTLFFVTRPMAGVLGKDEIWSVPIDGGEAKPLGMQLHSIWSMDISPDGKRLAFYDEDMQYELWVVKNLFAPKAKQ